MRECVFFLIINCFVISLKYYSVNVCIWVGVESAGKIKKILVLLIKINGYIRVLVRVKTSPRTKKIYKGAKPRTCAVTWFRGRTLQSRMPCAGARLRMRTRSRLSAVKLGKQTAGAERDIEWDHKQQALRRSWAFWGNLFFLFCFV